MKALGLLGIVLAAMLASSGCTESTDRQSLPTPPSEGTPYVLQGTQVWTVPDPVSRREYEIFVSLPASYDSDPQMRYPVLYVTDADYAFPIIRQIVARQSG